MGRDGQVAVYDLPPPGVNLWWPRPRASPRCAPRVHRRSHRLPAGRAARRPAGRAARRL